MPNFGMWEVIVIGVIVMVPVGFAMLLSPTVIRAAIKEIRHAWYDADPRLYTKDNHKDSG